MNIVTTFSSNSTAENGQPAEHNSTFENCLGVRQEQVRLYLQNEIISHTIVLWCKSWCSDCLTLKILFEDTEKELSRPLLVVHYLDKHPYGHLIARELFRMTGQQSVPSVFVASKHIGGYQETKRLNDNGELLKMIENDI